MRRSSVHSAVLIAAALLVISPCDALAQVNSADASATRAFLQADYAMTRAEIASFPAALAAIEALGKQVQTECPGVLANAPKPAQGARPSLSVMLIEEEEQASVFGAAARTEYVRRRSFARAVSRMRWSNRILTRLVHADVAAEAASAQLPAPDLCADMHTWVSSDYQTVSAATESYVQRESGLAATTDGAGEEIMHGLASYESQSDKRIVRKIVKLEKSALPALAVKFLAALGKVTEALHTSTATPAP